MVRGIKKNYFVIGTMSGTSLDGLDVCYCRFSFNANKWTYEILAAATFEYNDEWEKKLATANRLSGLELIMLNNDYAKYCADFIISFIRQHNISKIDFIASHGHTIHHKPASRITYQLCSGAVLAAECRQMVISDFRTLDVALGGQGAPLVPIGDELLFSDNKYCLNIGGIANISFNKFGEKISVRHLPRQPRTQ